MVLQSIYVIQKCCSRVGGVLSLVPPEQNAPNTLDGCLDGNNRTHYSDRSVSVSPSVGPSRSPSTELSSSPSFTLE